MGILKTLRYFILHRSLINIAKAFNIEMKVLWDFSIQYYIQQRF